MTWSGSRSRLATRLAALTPLAVAVVLVLVPGGYYDPVFAKPPDILGVPLGLVVAGIAMLWMLIGLAMVWRARTRSVEFIALVVFAIPATIVIVLAPPLILIMQNLG